MTTPSSGAISIGNLQATFGVTSMSAMRSKNPVLAASNTLNLSDMRGYSSGLVGWYDADSWTGTQWTDKSGNANHATTVTGTINTNVAGLSNLTLTGTTTAGIQFPAAILPTNFTFIHVTKYAGANQFRIWDGQGTSNNWLSGFWGASPGVSFHDGWLTDYNTNSNITEWILSTDRNNTYRGLGVDQAPYNVNGTKANISLNYGRYTAERSDWACAEALVFNKTLTLNEIARIEQWLASRYMLQYYPPITQGLYGYWPAEGWTPSYWGDLSGNGNSVVTYAGTITKNYNAFNGRDFVSGGTTASMTFPANVLPATYTLFSVSRYNGSTRGRILCASDTNWLTGHYAGLSGQAYHNAWLTDSGTNYHGMRWVLSSDQNRLYRSNGVQRSTGAPGTPSYGRLGINVSNEVSDWAVAMVIVYNRTLSLAEIQTVEKWLGQRYALQFTETHRYVDFNRLAIDRTGNSITTTTGTLTYSAGIFNNCAYFNNTYGENVAPTNYVTIPNGDFFVGTSISYWFKADSVTTTQTMVAATQSGNTLGALQMDIIGSVLRAYVALPAQWTLQLSSSTIAINTWYHVVLTITSGWVATLYVNGSQAATGTGTGASPSGWATNYMIGGSGSFVRGFKGYIDEFRVFTRVLTATEIQTLYAQQYRTDSILNASSAYRWLKFNESVKDETNNTEVTVVGSISYLQGINGQAAYFYQTNLNTASTNYITVPNNGYWGNMSVSFWFNSPAFNNTNGQTIVSLTDSASSAPSIQMDLQTSAVVRAYIRIPNYWTVNVATSTLTTNTWYHIVLTISSSHVCTIYLNGVQASTATGTGAPPAASCFMWKIGGSGDNARGYTGYLDEFRVFQSVLTANQILALYSEGSEVARVPGIAGATTSSTYDNLISNTYVPAMRVTPEDKGLQLWLDAEHYRPGSAVWNDQSDNFYNFSITTTAFRWDGTSPHMNFAGSYGVAKRSADVPTFANATIIAFTAIKTDPGDWRTFIRGYSQDHHMLVQTSTNLIGYYDATAAFLQPTPSITVTNLFNPYEFNMWVLKLSKTSPYWQLSYNGSTVLGSITNANAIFDNGFATIGGWQGAIGNTDPAVGAQFWGRFSQFMYYSRHLTDIEIKKIFDLNRFRYNIFWENDPRNIDDGAWSVLYDITNPTRDASGNIVYNQNYATSLAGLPFNRVGYYMQNKMGNGNTMYWVYVTMDAWSSTVTDYRIPDASNLFSQFRNVTNIKVFSNHPQVGNYSVPYGRVLITPYNYAPATTFGDGSATIHDYDDSVSVIAVSQTSGHGMVSIHDITNKKTLLAWSMHLTTYTVSIGIGNNDASNIHTSGNTHTNWTFAYNGAYGWDFKVLLGHPAATRLMYLKGFTGDTWNDSTGNGYNATYTGGTLSTPNYGGGYSTPQNQTSRYITLPEAALAALPSGYNWTTHTWMELLSTGTDRYFHNMVIAGGSNHAMLQLNTNTITFGANADATRTAGTNPTCEVNVPTMISLVRQSSNEWKLYKNGSFAASYSLNLGDTKTVQGWVLDQEQDSVKGTFSSLQNTNANWYEVSLMNRALDDDEIYAEYVNTKNQYGGDTLDLPVTSGLYLWLDASDATTFTLATNNVTEWRDKSGNNRHYTQATSTAQPLRNNTRNGRSIVTFDGTKMMSPATALANFANGTIIVVAKPSGTGYHCFYDSSTNYPMLWYRPDLTLELDAAIAVSPTLYNNNTWFYSVQTTGTRNEWHLNGIYQGTGRTPGSGALVLWNRSNGQYFNGDFAEILVYDRTLSTMEISLMNSYISKKWCVGLMIDRLSPAAKTSMKGAYSLRRLSMYYTGPTINVRRSTDNATSDFYADGNGNLGQTVDATGTRIGTWLGAATGYVVTWYDQSGAGNHATQTNTALQPTVSQANMWIDFKYSDANGRYMNLPDGTVPGGNGNYTVIVKHGTITGPTSLPTNGGWLASGSGATNQANNFRRKADGYWNYWYNVDAGINTTVTPGNIVTFRYDGANRYGYVNTTAATSVTASTNRNATTINNRIGTTIVNEHMNGEMYFLYIFDTSLSDADRIIAENS